LKDTRSEGRHVFRGVVIPLTDECVGMCARVLGVGAQVSALVDKDVFYDEYRPLLGGFFPQVLLQARSRA